MGIGARAQGSCDLRVECFLDFGVPREFIQSPGECVGYLRGQLRASEVLRVDTQ